MAASNLAEDEIICEINVTPLVDVSLVLVIIFMVVAPFFSQTLRPLILPSSAFTALTESNAIKVSVFADGQMAVGSTFVDDAHLDGALRREISAGRPPWVLVRAGTEVSHRQVMAVVKSVKKSGIKRVAFAAQAKPGASSR